MLVNPGLLAQLERRMGVALVDRSTDELRLTAEGHAVARSARGAFARHEAARTRGDRDAICRVRVGVHGGVPRSDVVRFAARLREHLPSATVSVTVLGSQDWRVHLEHGLVHVWLTAPPARPLPAAGDAALTAREVGGCGGRHLLAIAGVDAHPDLLRALGAVAPVPAAVSSAAASG